MKPAKNQRPLLAGMNCLPGQRDLFPTDGDKLSLPDAADYCAYCGERLHNPDDALRGSDNSRYCGRDCWGEGENELDQLRSGYPLGGTC